MSAIDMRLIVTPLFSYYQNMDRLKSASGVWSCAFVMTTSLLIILVRMHVAGWLGSLISFILSIFR